MAGHGSERLFADVWCLIRGKELGQLWVLCPLALAGCMAPSHRVASVGGYGAYGSRYRLTYRETVEVLGHTQDGEQDTLRTPRARGQW